MSGRAHFNARSAVPACRSSPTVTTHTLRETRSMLRDMPLRAFLPETTCCCDSSANAEPKANCEQTGIGAELSGRVKSSGGARAIHSERRRR